MCQRQAKRGPWNGTKCGARWVWVQGPQERAALQGADVSVVCLSNQIGFYRMVQLDSPKILDVLERALSEVSRVTVQHSATVSGYRGNAENCMASVSFLTGHDRFGSKER